MKAKALIAGAAFDPPTVKAMGEAFDQAWAVIAPKFATAQPLIVENARMGLAQFVIAAATTYGADVEKLMAEALRSMSPDLQN
jgi:hypothetical protein